MHYTDDPADEVVGDPEVAELLGEVAARQRGRLVGRLQHQGRRPAREVLCRASRNPSSLDGG